LKGPSQPTFVKFGSVVSKEKILQWTGNGQHQVMAKAHMTFGQMS
jgi:hypothetical protein